MLPVRTLVRRGHVIEELPVQYCQPVSKQSKRHLKAIMGSGVGNASMDAMALTESARLGALGCRCRVRWLTSSKSGQRVGVDAMVCTCSG
jgi:hypothetical protein